MNQPVAKRVGFLRRHWLISLFVAAGIGLLVWRWADFAHGQTPCPPGVARHARHEVTRESCPSLGQMNGVKLAIPQHYLLGPRGFKGIDIWNAESYKKSPKTNSFDNELNNFAIRIRLTNFKPIENFRDQDDYRKLGSLIGVPSPQDRWIHVGIDVNRYSHSFQPAVIRWIKDEAGWGPFIEQPDRWGLKHYLSKQSPAVDDTTWHQTTQWEFFYNSLSWTTFITCKNSIVPTVHRHIKLCELAFFIPEIQALVKVDTLFDDVDLARWPEIKREVSKVIQSFIVP